MKKFLSIGLISVLLLSLVGCNSPTSKNSSTSAPTPRPLELRRELLDEATAKINELLSELKTTSDESKKTELMSKIGEFRKQQNDIVYGINGEENYEILIDRLKNYSEELKSHENSGNHKKASELLEKINEIEFGNKEGNKTW